LAPIPDHQYALQRENNSVANVQRFENMYTGGAVFVRRADDLNGRYQAAHAHAALPSAEKCLKSEVAP
jgi:hypothetical protein